MILFHTQILTTKFMCHIFFQLLLTMAFNKIALLTMSFSCFHACVTHASHTNFSFPSLRDMCKTLATLMVLVGPQANLDDKLHVVVDDL